MAGKFWALACTICLLWVASPVVRFPCPIGCGGTAGVVWAFLPESSPRIPWVRLVPALPCLPSPLDWTPPDGPSSLVPLLSTSCLGIPTVDPPFGILWVGVPPLPDLPFPCWFPSFPLGTSLSHSSGSPSTLCSLSGYPHV